MGYHGRTHTPSLPDRAGSAEEYVRQVEAGAMERATEIRYSLVQLMYRLEEAATAA